MVRLVFCLARQLLAVPGFKEPDTPGSDTQQHTYFPSSDSFNNSSRENYYYWNSTNSLLGTVTISCVERRWWVRRVENDAWEGGQEPSRWSWERCEWPVECWLVLITVKRSCSLASAMSWFHTCPGQNRCLSLILQEWVRWLQPFCHSLPGGSSWPCSSGWQLQVEAKWSICSTHSNPPYYTYTLQA